MFKKIKKKIIDNYPEIFFITGIILIIQTLYKINLNLGALAAGAVLIWAGIVCYEGK